MLVAGELGGQERVTLWQQIPHRLRGLLLQVVAAVNVCSNDDRSP